MILKKKANFWIRSIARLIDTLLFSTITILLAWGFTKPNPLRFKADWLFYMWILLSILTNTIIWIIIPLLNKGKTIGNLITRTEIKTKENLFHTILKRESIVAIAWIITMLLIMGFANHTGFTKLFSNDKNTTLSVTELLRVSVIRAFGTIVTLIQLVVGASLLISSNKESIIDKYSKSNVVWKNKYEEIRKELKGPKPKMIKRKTIEFIN